MLGQIIFFDDEFGVSLNPCNEKVRIVWEIKKDLALCGMLILKVDFSQNVYYFGSNLQKKAPNHSPEHLRSRVNRDHDSGLTHFLGDWRQSEKISEIKSPLSARRHAV